VDRVPIDLGGHRSSGIMAIAYARLKEHLGIGSGDVYVYDVIQQLAVVEAAVLDELAIDTVEMGRGFCTDPAEWGGGCDTHRVLPGATPEEVAAHVRQQGTVMARGSGFVFQQVHNVMADVPPANVVAMLRAASTLRAEPGPALA
jgi:hypothetical protein